jgi:hypothetical protein
VDDPLQRKPDITQAEKVLGWRPITDLESGLKKTIAYFDALLTSEASLVMPESVMPMEPSEDDYEVALQPMISNGGSTAARSELGSRAFAADHPSRKT